MLLRRAAHPRHPDSFNTFVRLTLSACAMVLLGNCTRGPRPKLPTDVVVSVKAQKLAIYGRNGTVEKSYPVSTSKFGLNDKPGNYGTPLGLHEVVAKIGHGAPAGAVFKTRNWTGEIIKPNSPGRDPIVSRIMWLRGLERKNQNAYARCIYIHGTAEERNIGKPVSYGCIRMKSRDVIDLFNRLPIGARVLVTQTALPASVPATPSATPVPAAPASQAPIFLNPEQQSHSEPARTVAHHSERAPAHPATSAAAPSVPDRSQETRAIPQPAPGGGTVLYNAPTVTAPGMTLKSKRTAMQAIQN